MFLKVFILMLILLYNFPIFAAEIFPHNKLQSIMVNQTLISFKVDSVELEKFDRICSGLGVKRNKLLNFLVHYGNSCLSDTKKLSLMSVYERCMYFEFMK